MDHAASNGSKYAFFQHTECEFFPCHEGVPADRFNCLFCYCPLYALGRDCKGAFHYLSNGIKDCSQCSFPHWSENYGEILKGYAELQERMQAWDAFKNNKEVTPNKVSVNSEK